MDTRNLIFQRYIPRSSESTNWRTNGTGPAATKQKRGTPDEAGKEPDLREVLNRRNGPPKERVPKEPTSTQEYRSASLLIRKSSKPQQLDGNNNPIPSEKPARSTVIKASAPPFIPAALAAVRTKIKIEHPGKKSVNNRLKIHSPPAAGSTPSEERTSPTSVRTPSPPVTPTTPESPPAEPTLMEGDAIEELQSLCDSMKITDLKYELFRKGDTVACRVFVNKHAYYASLVDECRTEEEAKFLASKNALTALRGELERKNFPVCVEDDYAVAGLIYEMLRTYSQGVFERVIPEYFQKTYGLSLPDHWTGIIGSYSKYFTVERGASKCFLVFANDDTGSASDGGVTGPAGNGLGHEKLGLPWNEKYWNVYISNPASTTTVWARIIGDNFSNRMDAMMTDIEMSMITDQKKAQVIELRRVYLVTAASCWYRVRCQQMDFENNRALCFFIDIGEEEWFKMDQLFVCDPKFLELPPQVLMFSLYGLEGFEDNPHARQHLEKVLAGKTAVAEVISRQEEYEDGQKIKTLLFDTSGEEDVNLVELLLTEICAATPPPQLERSGVTDVKVTHINDDGDIYCQIRNSSIAYIQKLTETVVANQDAMTRHQGLFEGGGSASTEAAKRYLIFDRFSSEWFRATVDEKRGLNKEHRMFCIDYGCSKVISEKDIYQIEPMSMALHKYPSLAVKCRLYNIPFITENIVARMKGLLAPDSTTLVKMTVQGSVPQVNMYKRLDTNNIMFCVNETLRVEMELDGLEMKKLIGKDIGNSTNSSAGSKAVNSSATGVAVAAQSTKVTNLPLIKDIPLPSVNSFFNVFVTLASNPFNFIAQPYDQRAEFHEIMRRLQTYCVNNNEFLTAECIKLGQFYAAQHADGKWMRAIVERMFDGSIHVSFCDYGEIAVLGIDKLKMLPADFRTLPKQAIKCRLYGGLLGD